MNEPTAKRAKFVAAFIEQFGARSVEVAQAQASIASGEQKAAWLRIVDDLEAPLIEAKKASTPTER